MEWQGEASVIARRRHGENAVILTALSREAGLVRGLVPGGAGARRGAMLQPGNRVSLRWRARLSDQLGTFAVEPGRARPGLIGDALGLAGLNAVTVLLVMALPERDPHPRLADLTEALLDRMDEGAAGGGGAGGVAATGGPAGGAAPGLAGSGGVAGPGGAGQARGAIGPTGPTGAGGTDGAGGSPDADSSGGDWARDYLEWELALLAELGFGLDLRRCAVSGQADDLAWVSPRSGRAVSAAAAGEWAPRLIPLPAMLGGTGPGGLAEALALSGHFLATRLAEGQAGRPLPAARARLVAALVARAAQPRPPLALG